MAKQKDPTCSKSKQPVPRKNTVESKALILKLVPNIKKMEWPREMKLMKDLMKEFDLEFLKTINLGFKLNSLAYLIGGEGREKLLRIKKNFDYKPVSVRNEFEESPELVTIEYTSKKKTLRGFLK